MIDHLQGWFDGSDVVTLMVALLALLVSFLSFCKQRKVAEIEEERRAEELEAAQAADVRATLVSNSLGRQNLRIENHGKANAFNGRVDVKYSGSTGGPALMPSIFPLVELSSGAHVSC